MNSLSLMIISSEKEIRAYQRFEGAANSAGGGDRAMAMALIAARAQVRCRRRAAAAACVNWTQRHRTLRTTAELPGRSVAAMADPAAGAVPLARDERRLVWSTPPRNILVIKKPNDHKTTGAMRTMLKWLRKNRHDTNVIVEAPVIHELGPEAELGMPLFVVDAPDKQKPIPTPDPFTNTNDIALPKPSAQALREYSRVVDFVVTLGGDGTILHASGLFPQRVPPILSFSLGSLGFLLPFDFQEHDVVLTRMFNGGVPILQRMRFGCTIRTLDQDRIDIKDIQIMNELTVHRGKHAQLTAIDVFHGNSFLTDVIADGLIVSTPTGSTAYSLSAGGPIVHPGVQALLLTPICPRSLSFRPIVLPAQTGLKIQLSASARGHAEVTTDGRDIHLLKHGQEIEVSPSSFGIPCVSRMDSGSDWVNDIKSTLRWNQNFMDAASRLAH